MRQKSAHHLQISEPVHFSPELHNVGVTVQRRPMTVFCWGVFLKKTLSLHPPLSLHPSLPPPLLNYSFPTPQRPSRLPPLHVLTETGVLDSNTAADFKRHHITKRSRVWEKRPVAPRFSIPHHFFYSLGSTPLWSRPRFARTSETRHQTVDAQLHPAELEIRGGVIIHCSRQV